MAQNKINPSQHDQYIILIIMQVVLGELDKRGRTLLHLLAVCDGNHERFICLLGECSKEMICYVDKSGESALHVAARSGSLCCMRSLVDANIDLNVQSKGKLDSPLILAACHGHLECVQLLLEAKADSSLTTRQGFTAAQWAKKCGHQHIFKFLSSENNTSA